MTREIRGVPKLSGADVELSNFVLGLSSAAGDTCYEASRALLAGEVGVQSRNFHRICQ